MIPNASVGRRSQRQRREQHGEDRCPHEVRDRGHERHGPEDAVAGKDPQALQDVGDLLAGSASEAARDRHGNEAFAVDTHKFESRYTDHLVGPLLDPAALYRERSPSQNVDQIAVPVLVIQGAEDRVVPPSEAERLVAALAARGVPHAYLLIPGEDHGFRKAENILRAYKAELSFLAQIFEFELADANERIDLIGLEPVSRS